MVFPILHTDDLHLIELKETHSKEIFEILSRADVTEYYGTDPLTDVQQAGDLISFFQTAFVENRGIRWGILHKETKVLIGTIGFHAIHIHNRRAEIGYELHPDYWRKGYATQALKRVLSFGFEELAMSRIGAVVFPGNIASQNMLKNQGFSEEGLLRSYIRQAGVSHDTLVFSLLFDEWKKA